MLPTIPPTLAEAAERVRRHAQSLRQNQIDFLADLIRIKSYTGQEGPAVKRTLAEMKACGFDNSRSDSAGSALASVGAGKFHLLYDAHLDENEITDEKIWPHPPLQPTIQNGKLYGLVRVPVVKNQGIPAYEPRAVKGQGITYATNPMGADHTSGYAVATNILGVGGQVDPLKKEGQIELSRNLQISTAAIDSTGMCLFVAFPVLDDPEAMPAMIDVINARFGCELNFDSVMELGSHILKMEREFNQKAGLTAAHDRLPEFMTYESLPPHNVIWDFTPEEVDSFWDF
jgi:hypothetical protein